MPLARPRGAATDGSASGVTSTERFFTLAERAPEPAIGAPARRDSSWGDRVPCITAKGPTGDRLRSAECRAGQALAPRFSEHLSLPPARLPMWPFGKIPNAERTNEERGEAEEDHSHIKDHDASDKDHQSRQNEEDPVDDHRYR